MRPSLSFSSTVSPTTFTSSASMVVPVRLIQSRGSRAWVVPVQARSNAAASTDRPDKNTREDFMISQIRRDEPELSITFLGKPISLWRSGHDLIGQNPPDSTLFHEIPASPFPTLRLRNFLFRPGPPAG